jgi:hypothetical protein
LGFSLNQPALLKKYDYRFYFLGILGCGVTNGPAVLDLGHSLPTPAPCDGKTPVPGAPLSAQPWLAQWQAALSHSHANVVALLAGRWEVDDRVYMGQWTNILNPPFAGYVKQQLELASNLVTATGANMVFLTAPCFEKDNNAMGRHGPRTHLLELQRTTNWWSKWQLNTRKLIQLLTSTPSSVPGVSSP